MWSENLERVIREYYVNQYEYGRMWPKLLGLWLQLSTTDLFDVNPILPRSKNKNKLQIYEIYLILKHR